MQPLPAQTDAQDLRVDPRLPLVFDAKTARAYGYSRGEINHLLRSTRWSAVRRGLYCETVRLNAMGDVGRHAAQVLAALQVAGPNAAASRWSAAVLHGLPAPRQVPNHVSVVAPTGVRRQRNGMSVAVGCPTSVTYRRSGVAFDQHCSNRCRRCPACFVHRCGDGRGCGLVPAAGFKGSPVRNGRVPEAVARRGTSPRCRRFR